MPPEKPEHPAIECTKNGPYLVRNVESFDNSHGDAIPTRRSMALCRCGASKNKPFCDGSHERVGFNGDKREGRVEDRLELYPGDGVTIRDNRGICAHAGFCTDGCPAVWRMGVEPWIDPHGADLEQIEQTIDKCPSGALSYEIEGEVRSDPDRPAAIRVSKDGPYHVQGGIDLQGEVRGEGASLEHYTLCRCGGSKNKPFCDGTHWHIDFKDDEARTRADAPPKDDSELT